MFVALRTRNFRLLWMGLIVSFTGSFMQTAALLWHVSLLAPPSRKGLALGMVGLVRALPIVIFSLVSGVVADAWDRRRVMLCTQTAAAVVAAALAFMAFRGVSALWPIYLLAALGAGVGAFDNPARQALVPMLVPRAHLPNAISLNTTATQAASVSGPALAGVVIATMNVGWAYAFNAVSFAFVIVALLMMRVEPDSDHADAIGEVSIAAALEGLRFVFRTPLIRSTMLLDFFATFFASATALLPIFAQDILRVGPRGYGWLYAAPAAGAVVTSAAMIPLVDRIVHRGRALLWAVAIYGLATVGFGVSRSFWVSFLCLAATGAADTVSMVIRNIVRQLNTPNHLRGRMIGVNMVFFMGGPQLGELEAGLAATWLGAPLSVVIGGVGSIAATGWIAAATPALRHYVSAEPAAVTTADRPAGVEAAE